MSNADKEALIEHLEAALAILRNEPDASTQSGGSGNGPPPEGP